MVAMVPIVMMMGRNKPSYALEHQTYAPGEGVDKDSSHLGAAYPRVFDLIHILDLSIVSSW